MTAFFVHGISTDKAACALLIKLLCSIRVLVTNRGPMVPWATSYWSFWLQLGKERPVYRRGPRFAMTTFLAHGISTDKRLVFF